MNPPRKTFDRLISALRQTLASLPDKRTGRNTQYRMETVGLSAFSVFFTQSPSFLAHQRTLELNKGKSNAKTIFQIETIPSDNPIRDLLDPIEPQALFPMYDFVYRAFEQEGILDPFRGVHNTRLIALDGTWYFSSKSENVKCPNCSHLEHKNGEITHYHSASTPILVGPGKPHAIPLRPEFIVPQDGAVKQDCEIHAAKRWLEKNGAFYHTGNETLLGDDLYAHQPFCRRALLHNDPFIFCCKPDSHSSLYQWVSRLEEGKELHVLTQRVRNTKNHWEESTYRYTHDVPLAEGADALKVNWCEVTVKSGEKVVYHNAFITDWKISDTTVAGVVSAGRARWKIENENNNPLKTDIVSLKTMYPQRNKRVNIDFLFHDSGYSPFTPSTLRICCCSLSGALRSGRTGMFFTSSCS